MSSIKRLWNKNFAILWQGQLISDFGNAAFSVALGFWVLAITKTPAMPKGDMAMMGYIEACFALPAVLLGPVAGALADRANRKRIIIAVDFFRSVIFVGLGIAAFLTQIHYPVSVFLINQMDISLLPASRFPIFFLFPAAVLAGSCGSFFGPAISSAIPDIVSADNLSRANSARGFSSSLTQLIGNSMGGVLYVLLTAPVLILVNGVSFLYAAATQLFMKIPPVRAVEQRKHILHEMIDGMRFTFNHKGLRVFIAINMVIGFFSTIVLTLLTPLFKDTPGFGAERYGYVMGAMMAGAIIGMLALSSVKIAPRHRALSFCASQLLVGCVAVLFGIIRQVEWLFPLAFIIGVSNSIIGVLMQTVLQTAIPQQNRGKVFGILGTVSTALWPLGMASSGVIASIAGLRPTVVASCCVILLASLPFLFSRHFRQFLNTDITVPDG